MATMSTALATATMLPSSSSLASSSSVERGTLLVRVASLSTVETIFISLREYYKKKIWLKVAIGKCSYKEMLHNWQLYSQDLN